MWTGVSCSLLQARKNLPYHLLRYFCLSTNRIQRNVVLQKIHRNFLICRKREQVASQVYPAGIGLPYCRYHIIASSAGLCGRSETCHSCRNYSSMKDDDIVKSWINEIKDDFEKESKIAARNKSTENEHFGESTSDTSKLVESGIRAGTDDLQTDVENDLDKLEKLGFTTEEIIDLLKNAKKFDENLVEDEYELSDSESEREESDEGIYDKGDTLNDKNLDNDGKGATGVSANNNKMLTEDWAVVKIKPESDIKTDWSVVEIEDFVKIAEAEADIEEHWQSPVDLVRGKTGVYDIEELIEVLRNVNAQDIITIRIPKELNFADYMVITSANSLRHIKSITSDVKWIYKRKKHSSDDGLKVEGELSDWCALDLGNIILHIFLQAKREMYDLETLWTVGMKFDPQCAEEKTDPYVFSVDDLPWLKELEYQSENTGQSQNQSSDYLEKAGEWKHRQ